MTWRGFLLWPLFSAVVALGVCIFIPPTYTAVAMVAILPSARGWDAGGLIALPRPPLAYYGALLQSRRVADRVIDAFALQTLYGEPTREQTRERLADEVRFGATPGGQLMIVASAPLPWLAADMANRYAGELQRLIDELRVEAARTNAARWRASVQDVQQRLAEAHAQLQASQLTASHLKLELRLVGRFQQDLQQPLNAAELKLAALRTQLQDGSEEVLQQQALIDALRDRLRRLASATPSGTEPPGLPAAAREVQRLEAMLKPLRVRATQAEAEAGIRREALLRVDFARIPERPSAPAALLYMAAAWAATLAGLLLRAWWRRRKLRA